MENKNNCIIDNSKLIASVPRMINLIDTIILNLKNKSEQEMSHNEYCIFQEAIAIKKTL